LILASAFVLRVYGVIIGVFPFFREATYGMAAWRIIEGDMPYRDFNHPQAPLTPLIFAFVFLIFGVGVVQGRLFMVFFTTFTSFMIYLTGKRLDYKTGLLGSLVYAVAPWSVVYGMRMQNDHLAMTFCVIGYYFLTPLIMGNDDQKMDFIAQRNSLILAGLFVGIGVLIKIIVAPILFAFIAILVIEGRHSDVRITDQVRNVGFLILGFIIPLLVVCSPFYLLIGDEFTKQVLGQHFAKPPSPGERWIYPVEYLILGNAYFFVFFALSVFFAIRRPYGRGLIICILVMIFAIFFLSPRQYPNYYLALILWMSMVCGLFPFPDLKSLASKTELIILNGIIVLNLLFYKIYRYFNLYIPRATYFSHVAAQIALVATSIALIAFIVMLIKEGHYSDGRINDQVKNALSFPYQIWKRLRNIFDQDGIKAIIAVLFIVLIATTYISYFPRSESEKKTVEWIKANTSPDDYVLVDNLKINFWSLRRSPFAEVSIDRTLLGELTGEMFIEACYAFDVRVVVVTGRLFGEYETYDVFLEFLENNYVPITEGYTIYVRIYSLQ
ncbi:glycosyltransferase family 39 protein, partial [Candidatus Borrarchaeum sp.]|uniref:ArnT family glycosyltransferase n=1 Tax=Candidatus Borrarchaeum sp. TaxID=2846742 RepID=UPI00257D9B57